MTSKMEVHYNELGNSKLESTTFDIIKNRYNMSNKSGSRDVIRPKNAIIS